MTVITISRQFGSGGDEIADKICQITGYPLFNKQIIARTAAEVGLTDQEVIDYSEENYKVRGFIDRLMGRQPPIAQVKIWKENAMGVRVPQELQLTEEHALGLVQQAIKSACDEGHIVVVGRGGQVILKDCPVALHIRVEAPLEQRILRLRTQGLLANRTFADSVEARRAYQDVIEKHDTASADYLLRYYKVDWADPSLYHLVINTSRLSIELAAELVVELARKIQPAPQAA
jgi:cytidylate kinase